MPGTNSVKAITERDYTEPMHQFNEDNLCLYLD